jgi:hypothetical protein
MPITPARAPIRTIAAYAPARVPSRRRHHARAASRLFLNGGIFSSFLL